MTRHAFTQSERSEATMNIQELARRLEAVQPQADPRDVARTCLLLVNSIDSMDEFDDESKLGTAWKEVNLRLQVATDQHAAMTQELEDLAASDPEKFTSDQIWILVRAIKVQGQVLGMYLGEPALDY